MISSLSVYRRAMFPLQTALALLFVASLAGCGDSDGAEKHTISGTVTLDGEPVENGTITFVPADGVGPTAGAPIENGQYTAEVPPGSKKVEIRAAKVVGQRKLYDTPDSPTGDVVEELIPEKYNAKTTLTADVQGEDTDRNFSLQSK
jgi:hypothetical protein